MLLSILNSEMVSGLSSIGSKVVEEIVYACGHCVSEYLPNDLKDIIDNAKQVYRQLPCPVCQRKGISYQIGKTT